MGTRLTHTSTLNTPINLFMTIQHKTTSFDRRWFVAPWAKAVAGTRRGMLLEWGRQRRDGAKLKVEERSGEGLKWMMEVVERVLGGRKGNLSVHHGLRAYGVYH